MLSLLQLNAQSPCDFTFAQTGGTDVQFTNSYGGNNIIYEQWIFGDNNASVDVSSPLHTYYFYCFPPFDPKSYLVTHRVTVIENGVHVTYTCSKEVTVNCDGTSNCTDRYFFFRSLVVPYHLISALSRRMSLSGILATAQIWSTEIRPPIRMQPGTYLITQNYVAYGVSGTCSRWVTVGCCCDELSNFSANLTLDCAALRLYANTGCMQEGRYSEWTLLLPGQAPQVLETGFVIDCKQITNYSAYAGSPIQLQHRVFCEGQEVITTQTIDLPAQVEGIFIGVDKPCGDINHVCHPQRISVITFQAEAISAFCQTTSSPAIKSITMCMLPGSSISTRIIHSAMASIFLWVQPPVLTCRILPVRESLNLPMA
ncbi:MAG: PKD domain-containing protein [Lewinellaceae bacterium]|nr:PKD domain-containing protein [Lewinellaceae bacterium]